MGSKKPNDSIENWYHHQKINYFLSFNVLLAVCALINTLVNQTTGNGISVGFFMLTLSVILVDLVIAGLIYYKNIDYKPLLIFSVIGLMFLVPVRWALLSDKLSISFYWGIISAVFFAVFLRKNYSIFLSLCLLCLFVYFKSTQLERLNLGAHELFTPIITTFVTIYSILFLNRLSLILMKDYSDKNKAKIVGAYADTIEHEEMLEEELAQKEFELEQLRQEVKRLRA